MASAFAHVVVPMVIYVSFKSDAVNLRLLILAMLISVLPDFDVVAFKLNIPYESQWGHRGFTHSILFAAFLSLFCALFKHQLRSGTVVVFLVCFSACVSHALLDALTNGGLGVALYWPYDSERVFFAYRPIQVSPIGVSSFFTERGLKVISSELVWVFLPGLLIAVVGIGVRLKRKAAS